MLEKIIGFCLQNKFLVLLFTFGLIGFGLYSVTQIPIGAVPDVTNNQVQIITTSRSLATEDVEKFLTYPVELEMANLPEVKEIRSISKFGLSVITVVFDDAAGTYLPRQLIEEKIKAAVEKIPDGFGKPFMGPITTGLGEIYQYTIEVDPKFKERYSLTDLRTIQDWVVKRQLAGIPGVVEVNTWGGFLKQYEVALFPDRLRSFDLDVQKVYKALEENNGLSGGGYIEKSEQSYFIRAEGLIESIEDIENIVVENQNGVPIFVRDVARVGIGKATRFGAVTANGEGEKVLGQVMMLKDADSKAVIDAVHQRIEEISNALPPGIRINPFLERSELIGKTTFTIAENLILGCLIVIFVVVLLLGNLRSGLVVASVIPLSLLFALSMMYIFGVDANLMSLGAIDFGIIIDGAVIIVEFIAFKISSQEHVFGALSKTEKQRSIDQITLKGASRMMHSAIFGQVIIMVVFIPILSLVGVEGKMFTPMALVFCFALLGALILGLTYVPVVSSIFIKPSNNKPNSITNKMLRFLSRNYNKILVKSLRRKPVVLSIAALLLISAGIIFARMGGEFVPTLDEGDFVIQPALKSGTSLSETVQVTTKMERILKHFPEVDQVVSRIGAAEVPTDPMSMEESDVIIKLIPRNEWTTATNKDELADAFKSALIEEMPGVSFEFTQPIEMRFNELITGVRSDLAIKIFGSDLDVLYQKALEIEQVLEGIDGAADIAVEKIVGLPQLTIAYDRKKMAQYGVNVQQINDLVATAFAGKTAGVVFEDEKQFDLVLRFGEDYKQGLNDLQNLTVKLSNGGQLPLTEFATVSYAKGPAKISRDNAKRRIVISVNVRGRDLASVAQEAERKIAQKVKLPTGYTLEFGGQLENFKSAKDRLMIAVPIALVLIFILLFFAFKSIQKASLIFSAIPMAAVGGVFLLAARDLPFSISAGVGFIALFGIAVLNGIVLLEEFGALKENGIKNVNRRIIMGTKNRLRPVLLTASAAALGFLPMALSESAGAEVQRPLATVVVGGLISATALTLIVVPLLYAFLEKYNIKRQLKKNASLVALLFLIFVPFKSFGQYDSLSLPRAIEIALDQNLALKGAALKVTQNQQLISSSLDINQPEIYYNHDQNNIAPNNLSLHVLGINQSFKFPTVYAAQRHAFEMKSQLAADEFQLKQSLIIKAVSQSYYKVVFGQMMLKNYQFLDSIYASFEHAAALKYESGATNYLETLAATGKRSEAALKVREIENQIRQGYFELNQWMQLEEVFRVKSDSLFPLVLIELDTLSHPLYQYFRDEIALSEQELILAKTGLIPEFSASFFYGINRGLGQNQFPGFQVGMTVPLWISQQKSRIAASATAVDIKKFEVEQTKKLLHARYNSLLAELNTYKAGILDYQVNGRKLAEETSFHAWRSFELGEIDYLQLIQLMEMGVEIRNRYLTNLNLYNQTILELNFILN